MIGRIVEVVQPEIHRYSYGPVPAAGTRGLLTQNANDYKLIGEQTFTLLKASKFLEVTDPKQIEATKKVVKDNAKLRRTTGAYTGTDPEIFVLHGDGSLFPAFEFLPPKTKPLVSSMGGGWDKEGKTEAFWDGFQAEFSTTPSGCHAWLVDYIRWGLISVWEAARKIDPKANLTATPVVEIPYEVMQKTERAHTELGCDPSYNAYGPKTHLNGLVGEELPIRFAGCHVHIGTKPADCDGVVKFLDAVAGVVSVAVLDGLEDPRRREFYGLAGEYRKPEHGLEYRVLSSALLCHPAVTHLMFDLTRAAFTMYYDGLGFLWEAEEDEVVDTINTLNVEQAKAIIKRNKDTLMRILEGIYGGTVAKKPYQLIQKGAKNLVDTSNMEENWMLGMPMGDREGNEKKVWLAHSEGNCKTIHKLVI